MVLIKWILLIGMSVFLMAEKIEITSESMNAYEVKKEVKFVGNVMVKQAQNWLHGDEVVVYFDENNETKMYEASGNVTFEFKNEKNYYKGNAKKVTYYPQKSYYVLEGGAKIDDLLNKRHVNGEMITLDMVTGNANVRGEKKKPVKFIFEMEEKK